MILLKSMSRHDIESINEFLIDGNHTLVDFKITGKNHEIVIISYKVGSPTDDCVNFSETEEVQVRNSYIDNLIQLVDKSNEDEWFFFHKLKGVWYTRSEFVKEWTPMFNGEITSIETDSRMFKDYQKFVP